MGNTEYTVIISENAANELLQHVKFLAEVSIPAAQRLNVDIIDAANSLSAFPGRNPWLNDPVIRPNKYRKMVVAEHYLLIYQIKDRTVYIDYIVDCRQNYIWLLSR